MAETLKKNFKTKLIQQNCSLLDDHLRAEIHVKF